jgi:hypothetical protein
MTPENVAIFNNGCVGRVVQPAEPAKPAKPADPVPGPGVPAVPAVNAGGTLMCHANGDGTFASVYVRPHGMTMNWAGHGDHKGDIIPAFADAANPNGRNMTPANMATRNNGCVVPATAPGTAGPAPATVPAPPAAPARNTGYNVDGAVEVPPADALPVWLAAAGLVPAAAFLFRRSRVRARDAAR